MLDNDIGINFFGSVICSSAYTRCNQFVPTEASIAEPKKANLSNNSPRRNMAPLMAESVVKKCKIFVRQGAFFFEGMSFT